MAIFNTISITPSGSKGFPGETPGDVEYAYIPYEGSFLVNVASDLHQPFPVVDGQVVYDPALDDLVSPPTANNTAIPVSFATGYPSYPLNSPEGLTVIRFPRLDQNPQLGPSSANHPYDSDGNSIQGQIAEYSSLPSIHLQFVIQPVKFFNETYSPSDSSTAVNGGYARFASSYNEIWGTTNANGVGHGTRASNYLETQLFNDDILDSPVHVYQYESTIISEDIVSTSNTAVFTQSATLTPPSCHTSLGTRDIWFEDDNPNESGATATIEYQGQQAWIDEVIPVIPPVGTFDDIIGTSNIQVVADYFYDLLPYLRTGAGVRGDDVFLSDMRVVNYQDYGAGDFNNPNPVFTSANNNNQNLTPGSQRTFYINLNHTETWVDQSNSNNYTNTTYHPPSFTNSTGWNGTDTNPSRLIIFSAKNSYDAFSSVAICEIDEINMLTGVVKVTVLNTFNAYLNGGGEIEINYDISLQGAYQVAFLDYSIPIPDGGVTSPVASEGFTSVCDFITMVKAGTHFVNKYHYYAAYGAYAYKGWKSEILSPVFLYPTITATSWPQDTDAFVSTWFPPNGFTDGSTLAANVEAFKLNDIEFCYYNFATLRYNPQRFGLIYNRENQEFRLQISHLPPCIIKGTYSVF
jgi:hypothetical protein